MNIELIVNEARTAGRNAALKKLCELAVAGYKYSVHDEMDNGKIVGFMLDSCGYANIQIQNHRSIFWKEFKAYASIPSHRVYCAGTGKYAGFIDIFDMTSRQEVSVNVAAAEAAAEVLRKYGVECYVTSRLD